MGTLLRSSNSKYEEWRMSANLLKVLLKNQATFSAKLTEVQRRGLNKPLRNAVWLDSGNFPNSWEFWTSIGMTFGSLGNSQNPLKSKNFDIWCQDRCVSSKNNEENAKCHIFQKKNHQKISCLKDVSPRIIILSVIYFNVNFILCDSKRWREK